MKDGNKSAADYFGNSLNAHIFVHKNLAEKINVMFFVSLQSKEYSTIMSFYIIRSREQAKYEAVKHCSVLV